MQFSPATAIETRAGDSAVAAAVAGLHGSDTAEFAA